MLASVSYYPHMLISKVWIYQLLFVCLCVFVRSWISPARMKLAASNFAWWFTGVLNRESGELCSPEKNEMNLPVYIYICIFFRPLLRHYNNAGGTGVPTGHAYDRHVWINVRPEDGHTCYISGCCAPLGL